MRDAVAIDYVMLVYFIVLWFAALTKGSTFLSITPLKRVILALLFVSPYAAWIVLRNVL